MEKAIEHTVVGPRKKCVFEARKDACEMALDVHDQGLSAMLSDFLMILFPAVVQKVVRFLGVDKQNYLLKLICMYYFDQM